MSKLELFGRLRRFGLIRGGRVDPDCGGWALGLWVSAFEAGWATEIAPAKPATLLRVARNPRAESIRHPAATPPILGGSVSVSRGGSIPVSLRDPKSGRSPTDLIEARLASAMADSWSVRNRTEPGVGRIWRNPAIAGDYRPRRPHAPESRPRAATFHPE